MDERSLARFKRNIIVLPSECWFWAFGTVTDDGYGAFSTGGYATTAHRASYTHFVGPIPDGLHIDHLCHTWEPWCPGGAGDHHRRCVQWRHLEAVPPLVNYLRSRRNSDRCVNGHLWAPETTYINPASGQRVCRICRDEYMAEYQRIHHPGVLHGTETHCPQDHPYDEANTYIIPSTGGRMCRRCKRDGGRRQMRAKRGLARGYLGLLPDWTVCPAGHDLTAYGNSAVYDGQMVCMICLTPDGSRSPRGAKGVIAVANEALSLSGMLF